MGKKPMANDGSRISAFKMLAWNSRTVSMGIQISFLGSLQLYCTNALGMDAALVGTLLMISKIFDGVTDLLAGYIVDRTNTRWGRGRPYEFSIIGLWLTTWLLYSVPVSAEIYVKSAWVFFAYTVVQAIFQTLLNANQTVYMVRAFNNEKAYVKLSSFGGLIVTVFVMIFNVIIPTFQAKVLNDAAGWSKMVACIAIPAAIIGIMRFIFIKEDKTVAVESDKVKIKDVFGVLKLNKHIYFVALAMFVSAILSGVTVGQYYFIYVVKNFEISGLMQLFGVFAMLTLLTYPRLLKSLTVTRVIQIGLLFTIPSAIILFFADSNLVMLGIAGVLLGISTLPISFLSNLLIIDCANYNEWQNMPRMEGTMSSISGFAQKIGNAFGVFFMGIMLSMAHFDGALNTQPDSAVSMIKFLYAFNPLIWSMLVFVVFCFYKLDKLKPTITLELESRKGQEKVMS